MRLVVMYTRKSVDDAWFPETSLASYGKTMRKTTKTKRVTSVDKLTLWDFVEIQDVDAWVTSREEHREARDAEMERKRALGITVELIELEDGTGDEFFEFTKEGVEVPESGVWSEEGVDIDISKFFW